MEKAGVTAIDNFQCSKSRKQLQIDLHRRNRRDQVSHDREWASLIWVVDRGEIDHGLAAIPRQSAQDICNDVDVSLSREHTTPRSQDIRKQILDAAPELQKHLPRICVIPLYNSESDSHLNFNAQSDKNQIKVRNATTIIAERCYKLWMVNSLEEFKMAFLDIFECHHRAFSKAKVLHGEISAGNAMFYRHKTGGIVGCLDGFSRPSASAGDDETSHAEAVPFMALDVIDETKAPMPRFYRHDLESFVYLLVWAGVHFDIRRHAHGATNETLAPWEAHTASEFIQAYDNKSQFWSNDRRGDRIRSHFHEEFIPLWDEWVMPLRELFWDAWKADRTHRKKVRRGQMSELDIETLGGILTFDTFMKALGKQPRQW